MENIKQTFAKRLKEIREERGLTLADVAHAVEMSPQTYKRWESGHGRYNSDILARLVHFFNVRADYFIGLCDSK